MINEVVMMQVRIMAAVAFALVQEIEIYAFLDGNGNSDVSPLWFTSVELARYFAHGRRVVKAKVMWVALVHVRPDYWEEYDAHSFRLFRHENRYAVRTAKTVA